jgi:hypothetical protein
MGSDFVSGFRELWENRPAVIVLLGIGLAIFLFLVVDAWRRKKQ